jgi:hypothetical protein
MRFARRGLPVLVLIVLLGNGCGTGPAGSASAPASGSPDCVAPTGPVITVTELENGRALCARTGQRLEFYLHGSVERPWSPITSEGNPLSRANSGRLSLALGVTGAVFTTVAPGAGTVTSTRPTCASVSNGPTCGAVTQFRVVVSVHS